MKKILATNMGMTPAKQASDSSDLVIGLCELSDCLDPREIRLDKETIEELCVIKQIGLNQYFYYQVNLYSPIDLTEALEPVSKVTFFERGIGIIVSDQDGARLKREVIIEHDYVYDNEGSILYPKKPFNFSGKNVVVGCFVPSVEISNDLPNSIFTSEGTIILEDGDILMGSKEGLVSCDGERLVETIKEDKKGFQVPLKKPKRPKQGTIVFNKSTKKFEGYDGKGWVEL